MLLVIKKIVQLIMTDIITPTFNICPKINLWKKRKEKKKGPKFHDRYRLYRIYSQMKDF